jgi:hypothetical protein
MTCGYVEDSKDATPKDMMQGNEPRCSRCGNLTDAVLTKTDLPGGVRTLGLQRKNLKF